MTNNIQHDILLYFRKDALSSRMYPALRGKYSDADLKATFLALKTLGLVVRTNPRGPKAATFCITKLGRIHLENEYGIVLFHPDGVLEYPDSIPSTEP